jgi:hypothetical protein
MVQNLNCQLQRTEQIVYLLLLFFFLPKLDDDPVPWIEKLISMSNDGFWRTGWVYARIQECLTLSYNGLFTLFGVLFCCRLSHSKTNFICIAFLVSAGSLMLASPWQPVIGDRLQRLCVTPIAVDCSSTAKFCVRGFNIVQPQSMYILSHLIVSTDPTCNN